MSPRAPQRLSDAVGPRHAKKAVEWLQSDLAYWNEVFERNRVETCDEVQETVKRWKADRDLDGIRLETELAKLPNRRSG